MLCEQDIIGIILWTFGFLLEVAADTQKFLWKQSKPPKGEVNDHGVWYYSRHPNFGGEIILVSLAFVHAAQRGGLACAASRVGLSR